MLSLLNLRLAAECIKKPGRTDTGALVLRLFQKERFSAGAKASRVVELVARTPVDSESGQPVGPASRGELVGGGGGMDCNVCVRVCLLSCSPFAFGLSHQTAAVPESCPINIED